MTKRIVQWMLLLGCTLGVSVQGATIAWTNRTGGTFSDSINWASGVTPGLLDLAHFTNNSSYTVNLTGNATVHEGRLDADGSVVTINLGGYTWTATNAFYVSGGSFGGRTSTALVTNGIMTTRALQLGAVASSSAGYLTLRNVSNNVTGSGGMAVGITGTGSVTLAGSQAMIYATGGGTHLIGQNAGAVGEIVVSNGLLNLNSAINVGHSGKGTLVLDNGTNIIASTLTIGSLAGSEGRVNMTGDGALMVVTAGVTVADAAGSRGYLNVSNGTMSIGGVSYWGVNGDALVVLSGGSITSSASIALPRTAGTGILVMASSESSLINGGMTVPQAAGRGEIYLSNGYMNADSLQLGNGSGSYGFMSMNNSTLDVRRTGGTGLSIGGNYVGSTVASTGLVVLADERAVARIGLDISGSGIGTVVAIGSGSQGTLIISNGTLVTKGMTLGQSTGSRGVMSIEAGQVIVQTNSFSIGNGPGSTGWLAMVHGDAVLDVSQGNPTTTIGGGDGSVGELYVSNGLANFHVLNVAQIGRGYVEVGAATVTVASSLVIPVTHVTAGGTGVFAMVSADSYVVATNNMYLGADQASEAVRKASASLLVSNGTLRAGFAEIGRYGNGYMYIGAATVTVERTGNNGFYLSAGSAAPIDKGTGILVLAHSGSLLDSPQANFIMGNRAGSQALLQLSNGTMNVFGLSMAAGTGERSYNEIWMGPASINSTGHFVLGSAANSTSLITLTHADSSISAFSMDMVKGSNSLTKLILSNGSVRVSTVDMASGAGRPACDAQLWIHAATVTLSQVVTSSNALEMAVQSGNTAMVVLAHSGALLDSPLGAEVRLGEFGTGRILISNGVMRVGGIMMMSQKTGGQSELLIQNGSLAVGGRLTVGGSGVCVINLAHPNALLTLGAGGMRIADASNNAAVVRSDINISNGTLRALVGGLDHTAGSAGAHSLSTGAINLEGGTLDLANGNLLLGNRSNTMGILSINAGTALVGRLRLPADSADLNCTGTLQMAGGVLYLGGLESATKTTAARSNLWLSGGTIRALTNFNSTLNMELLNSPGPGVVTFDIWTNTVQLSGVVSGPGKLIKTGDGTLTLHQANLFGGATISSGVMIVEYGAGSGSGTGYLAVATGGTLAGTGRVSALNLGGGILAPGGDLDYVGTLTAGIMNWTNGVYRWNVQNFSGGIWDRVLGTGALTIASGIVTVKVVSTSGAGMSGVADNYDVSAGYTTTIASASSIVGFDANKFVVDISDFANDEGATWSISTLGTNLVLVVTPPVSSSRLVYWDSNATIGSLQPTNGVWGETSNTWMVGGVAPNVIWDNSRNDKALFTAGANATPTVRVDIASATNSGIYMPTLNNTHSFVINGTGVLTMVGRTHSFHIEHSSAGMTIGAPIRTTNGPMVKSGSGTLYLDNPWAENSGGWLIKTGAMYVGRGGTGGELGGGLITFVSNAVATINFNRSTYAITNPISGGAATITGEGIAWRAGATQNYLVVQGSVVVTQEAGALVYTNYVRVQPNTGNNTNGASLVLRGGSFYTKTMDIGYSGKATSSVVVTDSGDLSVNTLNIGANNDNEKGSLFILSNGTVQVASSITIGKVAAFSGSYSNQLLIDGGTMNVPSGTFNIVSNGYWVQTGGTFTNTVASGSQQVGGRMEMRGGRYYQGGHRLLVGGALAGQLGSLLITNDAEVRIVTDSTNDAGRTYLGIGGLGGGGNFIGEVVVAGGYLVLTNNLGTRPGGAGVARTNNGDIVLGINNNNRATLRVEGGRVHAHQLWMGGFNFSAVSGGSSAFEAPTGITSFFHMVSGEFYTTRGISNWNGSGSASNLLLSGGTIGALGPWSTSLNLTLTNSPGPGVTRFDPNGYLMTLAGALVGPGGLSMDGAGVLAIANNNNALGGVNYSSNGVLRIVNTVGLALGTNLLRVSGGGAVCGTGYVRELWVGNGGSMSAGECTNVGTLTAASTVWTNMTYAWNVLNFGGTYGTDWDKFSSTGTLTLAAGSTTTVKLVTLSAAGSYGAALNFDNGVSYTRLIASAKALSVGAGHTFAVDTSEFMNDEVEASVSVVDGTNIAITVESSGSGSNRPLYWDANRLTAGLQNGTGLWNNTIANWQTEGGGNVAWNNTRQDYAIFGGAAESGSWTVNVSGISSATNVGLSFLSGGTAYTVVGTGYLSFVAGSMITAAAPGTVNARLEGVGFTKVGAATLTLGGSNQMSGVVTISNGAVRLSDPWALGSSNGATVVASGGELVPAVVAVPTYREPLTLSGSGTNNQGALRFVTGSPTWVGTVTVVGATTRIGVDSGVSATLATVITGGVADVFVGGAGRLLVNGGVRLGTGKMVKDGTGVLSLRGSSAYSGGTIVSAGTLRVCGSCAANVAGTATIRLENGTVLGSETAASTIVNPLSIWGNVQLIDSSTSYNKDLTVTGAVDLNSATRTITVPSAIATLGGAISSGGITKSGAGTLVLGGVNTYASATTVSAGTLVHNGTNASSAVTTSAGTKLLGVGSTAATTVNGEIDPGAAVSKVGRLSMASLTLRPSSSIRVTITNATASAGVNQDLINCVGTLTVNATVGGGECVIIPDTLAKTPANFSSSSAYTWKIISAGGLSGFEVAKFTVSTASFAPSLAGGYFVVTSVGNDVYLKFFPAGDANIRVSVTDAPDPVGLSNSITYSIVVSNLSVVASPDMVLTNYLDSDTTYQSSTHGGAHSAGVVTWNLSSLAGSAFTTLTVVARADLYGAHTNVAHVSTDAADSVPEDNWATNVTEVACVAGNTPVINPVSAQSVVANQTLTFTVSAYDSGCAPPTLSATGLPSGVTYVTSNQYPSSLNSYITFTWTPTPGQVGTWPIRVVAADTEPNSTTKVVRIYVAGVGESTNSSGVPVSQTNWNVIITNINMSGNNAQVVWTSNEGLTYDVYSSAGTLGSSITWTRLTNGYEATASLSSSDFEAPETRRYFKVVPENEGVRDTFGIWGVFRPEIKQGYNLVAIPVNYPSRSFSGALGAVMAQVLEGNDDGLGGSGDEVLIMNDNGTSYRSLWLNASGEWTVSGGGSDTLVPGQGFFVLRRSASTVYPTFTGPVGTPKAQTAELVQGWNLLGLAEGWYNVTFSSVFGSPVSGAMNSGWDGDDTADEIQVLNANGSYTRYYYAPDGHWYNAQNDAVSDTATFLPGRAYYFKRDVGSLEVGF